MWRILAGEAAHPTDRFLVLHAATWVPKSFLVDG